MHTSSLLSRRLTLSAVAIVALLALGAGAGQAADPFRAGGRSTRAIAATAGHLVQAEARAKALTAALAIPAVSHRATRLDDRFEHRTYDEVASFDGHGREIAISRFDLDGTVAMAVALGWQPRGGRPLDSPGAARSAIAVARAAGLAVTGQSEVRASAGAGGWAVAWQRRVGGVPVRGDGIRISLWPDGSFHGLSRSERPLAAAPARSLTPAEARSIGGRFATERFGTAAGDIRVTGLDRSWLTPNDMFGPAGSDAPAATLRLAWVVRFETRGALAERLRSVELWLDAGTGALLGGDIVE